MLLGIQTTTINKMDKSVIKQRKISFCYSQFSTQEIKSSFLYNTLLEHMLLILLQVNTNK